MYVPHLMLAQSSANLNYKMGRDKKSGMLFAAFLATAAFVLACRLFDHWKAGLGPSSVCSQALQQLYPSTGVRLYQSSTGIATGVD